MRIVSLITVVALAASASAQTPLRGRLLGVWTVEYERTISRMHAEPTKLVERGRMTLHAVGDSLFGELQTGDSSAGIAMLRGTARTNAYTIYLEDPPSKGVGIFFSAFGSMMDWLRETVHGIEPIVVRFDLVARGDSLNGSRVVTGGMSRGGSSPVRGVRAKP